MISNNPLVSVIVPNFNHARYLGQRLESILNQTYRNIEVIILDDCSTDDSLKVIGRYSSDPRIVNVVINENNSGNTFLQWDKGLRLAKGELVWIAESDDYCELDMLAVLVDAFMQGKNSKIAYSTTWYVDEDHKWERFREGRTQHVSGRTFLRKYLVMENSVQNASCAIFDKGTALSIGTDYTRYRGIGDYWFWLRIAEKGNVTIVNRHLNYFRRHNGVVTSRCIVDGTNLFDERELVDYILSKYHFSGWRLNMISRYQSESKAWIKFDSPEIARRVSEIWEFDKHYSWFDNFLYKVTRYIRIHFLFYI